MCVILVPTKEHPPEETLYAAEKVNPHGGGIALCNMIQHYGMWDQIAVTGHSDTQLVEYIDFLQEAVAQPVQVRDGRYVAPTAPGWGLEFAWTAPGAVLRLLAGEESAWDLQETPVLSFRLLPLHGDSLNPASATRDLHLGLTDAAGRTGTALLSEARQGPLRFAAPIGAGTVAKSVYETYRLPVELFTASEPELDVGQIVAVEWVMDASDTGALAMDDVVFARRGLCE